VGDDTTAGSEQGSTTRLFLAGDVMTGRGIDQVLPRSVDPRLFEPVVTSARRYVALAEAANGPILRPVELDYVWGEALAELTRAAPAARIVNLETAVTTSDAAWPGKGIHYRMHPGNVGLFRAASIDVCVLANNHVLDWGRVGLLETLEALSSAGVAVAGAGRDASCAAVPAVLPSAAGRLLVFAFATVGSGVPRSWRASADRAGVQWCEPDEAGADEVSAMVRRWRRPGDIVVVSLHWGGNWGFAIPEAHRAFAHRLIDDGVADVIHGHSSHHPLGIEVHRGRLILYGCGDLVNDYEGIGGHEDFGPDIGIMYFVDLAADGTLHALEMVPLRMRRFRLEHVRGEARRWWAETLDRESRALGASVTHGPGGRYRLRWS
jgi:poly-gamma-glutamate capsule biosynthesis protein CapA/YwtB (metallophosphatase superfamily)